VRWRKLNRLLLRFTGSADQICDHMCIGERFENLKQGERPENRRDNWRCLSILGLFDSARWSVLRKVWKFKVRLYNQKFLLVAPFSKIVCTLTL
jgi:hypothetical protein